MALLATLHDHRRADERQALDVDATLRVEGRPIDALIADISASGCLFVCEEVLNVDDTVTIGIAGVGRRQARVVRVQGCRFGAVFETALLRSEIDAVVAMPDDVMVSFPLPIATLPEDPPLSATAGLSLVLRLAVIAGLAAATWGAVILIIHGGG